MDAFIFLPGWDSSRARLKEKDLGREMGRCSVPTKA